MSPVDSPHSLPLTALSWLRETDSLETGRVERALIENFETEVIGEGLVTVQNRSHDEPTSHVVGVSDEYIVHHCSCADSKYHDAVCKHRIRVALDIDNGTLDAETLGVTASGPGFATP